MVEYPRGQTTQPISTVFNLLKPIKKKPKYTKESFGHNFDVVFLTALDPTITLKPSIDKHSHYWHGTCNSKV
ncbi:hypothetical protein VCHA43P273_70057 [Vibrio chagasii]|nr:hypothetical protein VCHA34P120_40003 [Vibrio chagasii]CAH7400901.1 hypothetical protein VCHA43P273_70057 [Vibrio chagasii]CAH7436299.1 hypothetical protein VCHA38P217_40003 [Vibrio chagasii]